MIDVSPAGIRRRVAGETLCQSKVATATMIITATSAAIGMTATMSPRPTTQHQQEDAGEERREPGASAAEAFTLIIVWPIIAQPGHAAEEAGDDVGDALAARLAVLVGAASR